MRILKISCFLEKNKKICILLLCILIIAIVICSGININTSYVTDNPALFGVVGTLIGAIIGGTFSLLGSIWVNNRQQRAVHNVKRKNVIYCPLYDELVDIQNNILLQNPYPSFVEFKKGPQTISPHPQYDAWRRIKSDTRYLEVPKCLERQIEKLERDIYKYLGDRKKVNESIQNIINSVLVENGFEANRIINLGQSISKEILQNNESDILEKITFDTDKEQDDNEKKEIINQEIWKRCNASLDVIKVRECYSEWIATQEETIEMLSLLIKKVLLKYEE